MFLRAIIVPAWTAHDAVQLTTLVPEVFWPLLAIGVFAAVWAVIRKERPKKIIVNLLPLVALWPIVGVSMTVLWEKEGFFWVLHSGAVIYAGLVVLGSWFTRGTIASSISFQSFLGIYAFGEYFLCSMAISGKWL